MFSIHSVANFKNWHVCFYEVTQVSYCEYLILNHLVRGNNHLDFNMIHCPLGIHKVVFYIFILCYR